MLTDEITEQGENKTPIIKQIACGGRHNIVLTVDGRLFTFGFGQ